MRECLCLLSQTPNQCTKNDEQCLVSQSRLRLLLVKTRTELQGGFQHICDLRTRCAGALAGNWIRPFPSHHRRQRSSPIERWWLWRHFNLSGASPLPIARRRWGDPAENSQGTCWKGGAGLSPLGRRRRCRRWPGKAMAPMGMVAAGTCRGDEAREGDGTTLNTFPPISATSLVTITTRRNPNSDSTSNPIRGHLHCIYITVASIPPPSHHRLPRLHSKTIKSNKNDKE
ncbi:hypothetical protein Droror1_Dr00025854 [Drosera rotundifolia]